MWTWLRKRNATRSGSASRRQASLHECVSKNRAIPCAPMLSCFGWEHSAQWKAKREKLFRCQPTQGRQPCQMFVQVNGRQDLWNGLKRPVCQHADVRTWRWYRHLVTDEMVALWHRSTHSTSIRWKTTWQLKSNVVSNVKWLKACATSTVDTFRTKIGWQTYRIEFSELYSM